jgi:hypothetical protein
MKDLIKEIETMPIYTQEPPPEVPQMPYTDMPNIDTSINSNNS